MDTKIERYFVIRIRAYILQLPAQLGNACFDARCYEYHKVKGPSDRL